MTTPLRLDVRRPAAGGESEFELSLDVPSDLGYVGPAVELIADRFRQGVLSPRRVRFNLRTALAEALANAIAYGNRLDARRLVHVRVEAGRDAVHIHVTDTGDGFDPSPCPTPRSPGGWTARTGAACSCSAAWWITSRSAPEETPSA